jgi:phosphoglucan, water dikinase
MRPSLEALAPLYVYLHWIATGSVSCVEGGGHFRPNKHAELAKIMFRSLEWVIGDSGKCEMERLTSRRLQVLLSCH